jgi:hypothetical protein
MDGALKYQDPLRDLVFFFGAWVECERRGGDAMNLVPESATIHVPGIANHAALLLPKHAR